MEAEYSQASGGSGIRKELSGKWKGPPEALSLLRAVCLGDRSGLSEALRQSYSMAGGMHVLAVSGLHVGLIWWVLHRLFSFLVRILRKGDLPCGADHCFCFGSMLM